jgi:hypothetical protein
MYLGAVLLLAGAFVGWIAPALGGPLAQTWLLDAPLSGLSLDVSGYLGADITALAVIIAVLIGFNVAGLQIAGQALSLSLVRAWLLSLTPFLLCWSVATTVALTYYLEPPSVLGQLWQMLLWFGAVVLLMVGYLWNLPWQLSGEYAAAWALRALTGRPVAEWESLDGYSVLQTGVASASRRGELVTVRVMCMAIGGFLAHSRDPRAERENTYDRRRYRALKNLLSGSAQHIASPPNAIAYYLGHLTAGAMLQAAALGHPVGDARLDLFSSLFRAIGDERERLDPLWTGVRHAMCRKGPHGEPYLLAYWREHQAWAADDPRRTRRIAEGLLLLHAHCWRTLRTSAERGPASGVPTGELLPSSGESARLDDETRAPDALLLIDLYGDLGTYLGPEIAGTRSRTARRLDAAPLHLLDAVHQLARDVWYPRATAEDREAVSAAYAEQREALARQAGELAGVNDPARTAIPVAR